MKGKKANATARLGFNTLKTKDLHEALIKEVLFTICY
jgi:hypothetical protein